MLARTEYDDVIVGAGSAGCVLANRLSADAGTRVLVLDHAVTLDELADPDEVADIAEDMKAEAGKYGHVLAVEVPAPGRGAAPGTPLPPGTGRVFIEFATPANAIAARAALHGRRFGGRAVEASFMVEEAWAGRDLGPAVGG